MKIKEYRAAGGVVVDHGGRVLMIERDIEREGRMVHEVRLPKGKLEPGETDEQAALREVGEESGYWELAVLADLGENTVEFELNGKRVRRDEHYYLMRLTSDHHAGQQMKPGSEEALFKPTWAGNFDDAERRLTFAGERDFVRRAKEKWNHR
jgi:8-oxo-dGTP pyrophosphatase MutT (NUDIX family)